MLGRLWLWLRVRLWIRRLTPMLMLILVLLGPMILTLKFTLELLLLTLQRQPMRNILNRVSRKRLSQQRRGRFASFHHRRIRVRRIRHRHRPRMRARNRLTRRKAHHVPPQLVDISRYDGLVAVEVVYGRGFRVGRAVEGVGNGVLGADLGLNLGVLLLLLVLGMGTLERTPIIHGEVADGWSGRKRRK